MSSVDMEAGAPGHQGSFRILLAVGVRLLTCFCPVRSGGSDSAEQGKACSCERLGKGGREGPFLFTKCLCLPHPLACSSSHPGSTSAPLSALGQACQSFWYCSSSVRGSNNAYPTKRLGTFIITKYWPAHLWSLPHAAQWFWHFSFQLILFPR